MLVALLSAAVAVIATSPGVGAADGSPCDARAAGSARDFVVRAQADGGDLDAFVHVPAQEVGRPAPLVLAFHGTGGSGRFMRGYSGLAHLADREGFAVAFPTARSADRVWELEPAADPADDDVVATRTLLDRILATTCVDPARVSAVGISNGGGFAARLACELSDRLAGVVVVAGGFARLPPCRPARRISVLEIHGTADQVVPYGGDSRDAHRAGAVRPWLAAWARRDGCRTGPRRSLAARGVVRFDWRCPGGVKLAHIMVLGGEHAWPGATPRDPGPSPISAGEEAWRFLAGVRR